MLVPVLLVLLAAARPLAGQEGPPPTTVNYVGDELMRIDVNDTTLNRVTFTCPDPRTDGIKFMVDGTWTPGRTFFGDFSYTRGDINSLRRMRQKLGPYHCITDHGRNRTVYAFVLSERPHPRTISQDNIVKLDPTVKPTEYVQKCPAGTGDSVVWEKYQEYNGLFVQYANSEEVTITYKEAEHNMSVGFTMYRCYNERTPENIFTMRLQKQMQTKQFRTSQYESTVLAHYIKPSISVPLECKGSGASTGQRATFRFKPKDLDNETYYTESGNSYTTIIENYRQLRNSSDWMLQYDLSQSQVQVVQMQPFQAGFYSCVKDGVLQRTVLDVDYGEVSIKDHSKKGYPLHRGSNLIDCSVTEKDFRPIAYFLLRLPTRVLRLEPNSTVEGFTTVQTPDGIRLTFSNKPELVGRRLECRLPFTMDYTDIEEDKPVLRLTLEKVDASYLQLNCTKDREFSGVLKTEIVYPGDTGATISESTPKLLWREFYAYPVPKFALMQCYTQHEGGVLRSNILMHGSPDANLSIIVERDLNPPKKVFLEGRDVSIVCSFSGLVPALNPTLEGYFLEKDGRILPSSVPKTRLNETQAEFVVRRAAPADSGRYVCVYNYQNNYTARSGGMPPVMGSYRSPVSELSICSSSQFVCDSTCKDRRLMCDKKQDCADGTDEREEYCSKCEPNEVRCKTYNGVGPRKRCVLKHWLCDAQDDCGNGYDEDTSLHRKWCFKEALCNRCNLNETCCPGPPNSKCIPRTYECDKERDCPGPSEELKCTSDNDCLRLTSPTARQIINKRVGDLLTMTCVAVGTERPTINWRRNWAALPASGVDETNRVMSRDFGSGAYTVEGKLQFTSITKAMAGIYNCEAVNNCKRLMSYEIDLRVSD